MALKKRQLCLIKLVGVPPMWVLLLPFGRGIEGPCFDFGCGGSEVDVSPVACDLRTLSGTSVGMAWGQR